MTILDVKNAVVEYGFSRDLADNDGLFYTVLNLAVKEANRLRPITECVTIVHEPMRTVASYATAALNKPDAPLAYTATARTVVFEVTGSGGVQVVGATIDGVAEAAWSGVAGWKTLVAKAASIGNITLRFSGDYPFYVRNVAFYDVEFPSTQEVGDITEYDLSLIVDRFASVELPMTKNGVPYHPEDPRTALVGGKLLRIPNSERGTFEIVCEVYPPRYTSSSGDGAEIPLDPDIAELVPLLVASYIWLDDEPEKAARYKNLYDLAAREIPKHPKISHCIDRKGWS